MLTSFATLDENPDGSIIHKMKILFICTLGIQRSRTAADLFKDKYETRYKGVFGSDPPKKEDVEWADKIIVMEKAHETELRKKFPKLEFKIINLDIPDIYFYNDPELKEVLERKVNNALK